MRRRAAHATSSMVRLFVAIRAVAFELRRKPMDVHVWNSPFPIVLTMSDHDAYGRHLLNSNSGSADRKSSSSNQ